MKKIVITIGAVSIGLLSLVGCSTTTDAQDAAFKRAYVKDMGDVMSTDLLSVGDARDFAVKVCNALKSAEPGNYNSYKAVVRDVYREELGDQITLKEFVVYTHAATAGGPIYCPKATRHMKNSQPEQLW